MISRIIWLSQYKDWELLLKAFLQSLWFSVDYIAYKEVIYMTTRIETDFSNILKKFVTDLFHTLLPPPTKFWRECSFEKSHFYSSDFWIDISKTDYQWGISEVLMASAEHLLLFTFSCSLPSYSAKWVQKLGCYSKDFPTPSFSYPIRNSYLYVSCYFLPQDVYYYIFSFWSVTIESKTTDVPSSFQLLIQFYHF